jgi:hypothetical protein
MNSSVNVTAINVTLVVLIVLLHVGQEPPDNPASRDEWPVPPYTASAARQQPGVGAHLYGGTALPTCAQHWGQL